MSDWLLHKYIGILSPRLERFKRKGPALYNFRCNFCGDSTINKTKARAYIYEKKGKLFFHCHNCNKTLSAENFIKEVDLNVYNEYLYEKLQDLKSPEQLRLEEFTKKMEKPVFLKIGPLKGLKKVSQLSIHDPVKKFVEKRKIPNPYHAVLFSCPNFKEFTNRLVPNKFDKESLERDETRLFIPFFDKNKNLHAYQGRAIGSNSIKYITIILNDDVPKVYGLDKVDFNKKTYVFEGPIDSMFIPNSIATAGGDLVSAISTLIKTNMVVVYDNEPRSRDTIKKLDKAIMQGYNVCIWPENFTFKDVNDAILGGLTPEFIKYIIDTNTHKDLMAKLKLTQWSKI
jgi:transcription elongation factor Elf1